MKTCESSRTPGLQSIVSVLGSDLPVVMMQDKFQYSVVLNFFGIEKKDIYIDLNNSKHELGIYAGQSSKESKSASFWIFGVPHDGMLKGARVAYKGGGLQITVPRQRSAPALAA